MNETILYLLAGGLVGLGMRLASWALSILVKSCQIWSGRVRTDAHWPAWKAKLDRFVHRWKPWY